MESKEIDLFVYNWLKSQDADGHFIPDENGYMMFKRGALSINLPAYLSMAIEDYLEEYSQQSQPIPKKDKLEELEEWVNKNWQHSTMIIYPKDELLSKIQELKNK